MKHGKHTDKKDTEPAPAAEPAKSGEPQPAAADAPALVAQPSDQDQIKDRLLRLQADFDNFRKRMQREKAETYTRANEDIVMDLLIVLDHFEKGLATASEHKTEKSVRDGFQIVFDQLLNVLKKFGVTPIDAHESAFDPHQHEAVAHVPSEEYPADQIIAQLRRGYKMGDRLIRPVQVVVSSGPGAPRDDGEKAEEPPTPVEG